MIKDGIIFDAKALLQDVAQMVRDTKDRLGYEIVQPGWVDPVHRR